MRMLSLTLLAASAAILPSAVSAQPGPHPGPPAGHGWRGGVTGPAVHGPRVMVPQMGRGHMGQMGRGMHPGRNFRHGRLRRGFTINPFWFGPQFQIQNWQMYGFSDPGADGRWVRYYDDAYLIDHGGRVLDTRYGMDWDEYGEEWGDDDGIPAYRGRREWRGDDDGDDDYAREEHRGGDRQHGGRHHRGGPMPGPGYGYGYGGGYGSTQVYGGGYGYGFYAYPIVIETITTTGGGYSEEVTEEYVEVRQRHRAHRARPRCRCAPPPRPAPRPRPPAGERG